MIIGNKVLVTPGKDTKEVSYDRMTFDSFKDRAKDSSMTAYEKIGFPDDYRNGKEENIFNDLNIKLELQRTNLRILDIGCGCSDLVDFLIENAKEKQQTIILNDCDEMLDLIKDMGDESIKLAGRFPECSDQIENELGNLDAVIVYSVMQHIILEANPYSFIDKALGFLKPGGRLILGDIPNSSMRNRYFHSETGLAGHKKYLAENNLDPNTPVPHLTRADCYEKWDDGMIFGVLQRYRNLGYNAYIVPQPDNLPMANRREDILIYKV